MVCAPPPLSLLSVDIDGLHPPTVLESRHSHNGTHLLLGCASSAFFCTLVSQVSQVPQVVGQCQAQPAHARLDLPARARVLAGAGVGAGVGAGAGAGF